MNICKVLPFTAKEIPVKDENITAEILLLPPPKIDNRTIPEMAYLTLNEDKSVSEIEDFDEWLKVQCMVGEVCQPIASTTVSVLRFSTVFLPMMHSGGCFESALIHNVTGEIDILSRHYTYAEAMKYHEFLTNDVKVIHVPKSRFNREFRKHSRVREGVIKTITVSDRGVTANFIV